MAADSKATRRYHASVERALGLFDASNEWADYIAFLSRLIKALQASPPGADVPMKKTLAKYLAQCLQPSLPSGVHQKALETYRIVFSLLGTDGLSRDLATYLPGLSHTLVFASLSTRPLFLSLFDDHILKLPSRIVRPALKAVVLSLLPGIEEENSEDFERTLGTINRLRQIFEEDESEELFWQSLFLASITSPSQRPGALVYLSKNLPRSELSTAAIPLMHVDPQNRELRNNDAIQIITKPEPGMLIRCFATGLQDEQALTQRGFLDLLVTHLPLRSLRMHYNIPSADLDILVLSAMTVVLRRDMGLNRRLWFWFTGSEDTNDTSNVAITPKRERDAESMAGKALNGENQPTYFSENGLDSVVRCFQKLLAKTSMTPVDRARPFRILLSMMDRWEIGGPVVQTIFISLMKDLLEYQTTAPSQEAFDEVFRSANAFFDGIEPHLVANQLHDLLERKELGVVEFIISNFSLQEDELLATHLPLLAFVVSLKLVANAPLDSNGTKPSRMAKTTTKVQITNILDLMLELSPGQYFDDPPLQFEPGVIEDYENQVRTIYDSQHNPNHLTQESVSPQMIKYLTLRNIANTCLQYLDTAISPEVLGSLLSTFEKAMAYPGALQALQEISFVDALLASSCRTPKYPSDFEQTAAITRLMGIIKIHDIGQIVLNNEQLLQITPGLVRRLWGFLLPHTPQFHVEAVDLIWNLRSWSTDLNLVDSTIMSLLKQHTTESLVNSHPINNFGIFWSHTRSIESIASPHPIANGHTDTDNPWSLLRHPILHILDEGDPGKYNDRYVLWLVGLSSLRPVFRLLLDDLEVDSAQEQLILLTLRRLQKLLNIARLSTLQWQDFHDQTGPNFSILDVCSRIVYERADQRNLVLEALQVIKTSLHGMKGPIEVKPLQLLTARMTLENQDLSVQNCLIDIMQTIYALPTPNEPPTELIHIITQGISVAGGDSNIDIWISLLCTVIPLFNNNIFFTNLLKMTACFCDRIQAYFAIVSQLFAVTKTDQNELETTGLRPMQSPERLIASLFTGLEFVLARAHVQVMRHPRPSSDNSTTPNHEATQSRTFANNRLTIILCMQDAIRVSERIWSWRLISRSELAVSETKSFGHLSARLRSRTRRFLERLIEAEPQECMETLMGMWVKAAKGNANQNYILNLLQSLDGARPKYMMPATFNAIFCRTNPSVLDDTQRSSLSVDVSGLELTAFLTAYVEALEDDLLEEIWADCTTFLREVLANPMPHRQLLLRLLAFVAALCRKMENTTFGEESRMRRELADLCTRLFMAIFTIKPGGLDHNQGRTAEANEPTEGEKSIRRLEFDAGNPIALLCQTLPSMNNVLTESDRLLPIYSGITTNITGPGLRSRFFPQNISSEFLSLLHLVSKVSAMSKIWRKDVLEAFNDAKFFSNAIPLVRSGWMPLIKQISLSDKAMMGDLLSRLTPPSSAGLMFGVGASTARIEVDKKTQLNLRRIGLLLLSADKDNFIGQLSGIITKIEELFTATPSSSPSSNTRGDVYMLIRVLILTFSHSYLGGLWLLLDLELKDLFTGIFEPDGTPYNDLSKVQGAKLLDLLLVLKPDEFQLHEWLFVTDTVDAIYPPANYQSIAIADNIPGRAVSTVDLPTLINNEEKRPWLSSSVTRKIDNADDLLRSFFAQLSIHAFEDAYSLKSTDISACHQDILMDMFADS